MTSDADLDRAKDELYPITRHCDFCGLLISPINEGGDWTLPKWADDSGEVECPPFYRGNYPDNVRLLMDRHRPAHNPEAGL